MIEWKISLSDIDLGNDEITAVTEVLKSKWLTMGSVTQKFESAFAEYLGVKYAFATANGTAALHIAHRVLGVGYGDEVLCPSLTFVATANSILYTGASPVFVDITSLEDLNISPDDIVQKITHRTKGITLVHYGGYPCNMDGIMDVADSHKLWVVEDAAHAPGAEYKGRKGGTFGDVGCFSFFSNKNLAVGEGGMIVTNRDDLAEKIKLMRSHGMTTLTLERHRGHAFTYDVADLGYNYRIDEVRSSIGLVQLSKLEENNEKRKRVVREYITKLRDIDEIIIPFQNYNEKSAYHLFPIILNTNKISRNEFMTKMREKGIQTSIHYPPIHLFSYYRKNFGFKDGLLPLTEKVSDNLVTLPLYPNLADFEVKYIWESILHILEQ